MVAGSGGPPRLRDAPQRLREGRRRVLLGHTAVGSLKRPPSRLGDLHAQNFDRLAAAHHALRARGREARADQFVEQLKREAVGQ